MKGHAPTARAVESRLDFAAKAASYNIVLQVLMRISTFLLNGFILRFIAAEVLGVVNMRLMLLYNTVLFLSREAFRKACLSLSETTEERKWRLVFNLIWCCVPVGLLSSLLLSALWLSPWVEQPSPAHVPWDPLGVALFSLSALTELLAEPLWVVGQLHQYVSLKVAAEGLPQLLRCGLVVVGVVAFPSSPSSSMGGVLVFSLAQLAYSIAYTLIYYGYFSYVLSHSSAPKRQKQHRLPMATLADVFPKPDGAKRWFSPEMVRLAWSFFKQSFLKQILTDGERYVMTILGVISFAEQGVYDIIGNLGSLVARFIFLPIEESFYVFFAGLLFRGEPIHRQKKEAVELVVETLPMLLKFVLMVALTILAFGYAYSFMALNIYGGPLLSQGLGPTLLRWYCVYVLLLSVNGVTECFVFAAMSQADVDRYNGKMLLFSLLFLSSSVLLTNFLGSVGFIMANCVNMAARICHSCYFIRCYFAPRRECSIFTSALPSPPVLLSFALSFILTASSELVFCKDAGVFGQVAHVLVGCLCLSGVGAAILLWEPALCSFLLSRLPSRAVAMVTRLQGVFLRTSQ